MTTNVRKINLIKNQKKCECMKHHFSYNQIGEVDRREYDVWK